MIPVCSLQPTGMVTTQRKWAAPLCFVRYRQTPVYTHRQATHIGCPLCPVYTFDRIGDFNEFETLLFSVCHCPERHDKYRERFFHEQLLFGECYRFSDTFGLHIGNGGLQTLLGKCRAIYVHSKIVYICFITYIHRGIVTPTVSPQ